MGGGVIGALGMIACLTSYGVKTRGGDKVAHDCDGTKAYAWDAAEHKLKQEDIIYSSTGLTVPPTPAVSPYSAQPEMMQPAQPQIVQPQSMQQSQIPSGIQEGS